MLYPGITLNPFLRRPFYIYFFVFLAKQKWNSHKGFCIKGETLRGLFRIESLDECRQMCEQEAKCLSVDYSLSLARCFMNKVGTTTSSIIKCPVEGFQFSEPISEFIFSNLNYYFFFFIFHVFIKIKMFFFVPSQEGFYPKKSTLEFTL